MLVPFPHLSSLPLYLLNLSSPLHQMPNSDFFTLTPPTPTQLYQKNQMASASAIAMALPLTSAGHKKAVSHDAFFNPMKFSPRASKRCANNGLVQISASMKEKAVTGLTALALTAALVIPDVAEAAQPGISPSLKNFLLSIVSGGVVLGVIVGAVIGVANFDPVKRT